MTDRDLLIITVVLALISAVGQFAEVFLNWWMLQELGDLDGSKKDWWEKIPFRKKKDAQRKNLKDPNEEKHTTGDIR